MSDADAVATAVDRVAAELGPPTVLVNNAGVIRDNLLFKMTDEDWDIVMAVHLRGAFLMSRAAQKYMTEQKWGRIVNLSSTSALGNRGPGQLLRGQGRPAGLHQDARDRARPVRRHRERDRARLHRHRHDRGHRGPDGRRLRGPSRRRAAAQIPVRRVGQPEDIATLVSFLVSEGAGFVSGQVIYVAGGPRD